MRVEVVKNRLAMIAADTADLGLIKDYLKGHTALIFGPDSVIDALLLEGGRMAERRRAKGKTQTQVAALMHTSPAIVSRLESGHDVRVSTLEKYVAALGLRAEARGLGRVGAAAGEEADQ